MRVGRHRRDSIAKNSSRGRESASIHIRGDAIGRGIESRPSHRCSVEMIQKDRAGVGRVRIGPDVKGCMNLIDRHGERNSCYRPSEFE